MKTTTALFAILALALVALAPATAMAQEKPSNYLLFKGGFYDPTNNFTLSGPGTQGLDFRSESSFYGEGAIGHYFMPFLAFELAAGYFENEATAAAQTGKAKLKVIPVVLTGKLLAQLGPVEPYIMGGIGAYLTEYDADATLQVAGGSTRLTYGLHAGGGINFDITRWFFIGAEGRYLWAEPEFGGRDIKLDGYAVTGDLGFRF